MNMFEINKIAGALLGSVLLVLLISEVSGVLVHPIMPEKSALAFASDDEAKVAVKVEKAPAPSFGTLMASANMAGGEKMSKKCKACHTFKKGGPDRVGPNLWNIVGRDIGSTGFKYSSALKKIGGQWTFADLDSFLTSPKKFVKGTKMAFKGISDAGKRANLIFFLRALSDSPAELPK